MNLVAERGASSSVVDVVAWRAAHQPDRVACTFLVDGDNECESLRYASLDHRARVLASRLLDEGAAGERALLLYPAGIDFLVALFGCFYAGVIAVPLYPPKLTRRDARCIDVAQDCGARFALTTTPVFAEIERALRLSPELGALHWIRSDEANAGPGALRMTDVRRLDVHSIAYLQYTSGSTRAPKGVMVSHGNLLANIEAIQRDFHHREDSVSVSWLPHFHDMGLVYGLLTPLTLGFPGYFMSPMSFLQRPYRWLDAISRFGATHSGGPNFAYQLCVDRVTEEQKDALDLSRWAVAFNGAEPVRKTTLDAFATTFARSGFSSRTLCPAYGLAETTLKVTTGHHGDGPTYFFASADALGRGRIVESCADDGDRKALVGCGRPEPATELLIVDPETLAPRASDQVGEIWVNSPSVAKGYWNRPEESALVFEACPSGQARPGRFLRTGDLGFLRNGELFVTGRIKDLIIIRGRNHYPHDVELTVQHSHPSLRVDAGAAFSLDVNGEERLVIVHEIDRHHHGDAEDAVAAIRTAISEEHEIAPYAVVLVRQNAVPKTSSGKIQRTACAQAFLDESLPVVAAWKESIAADNDASFAIEPRSQEDIEAFLAQKLATSLSIPPEEIDVSQPFSSFGLDSMRTVTLVGELEEWLGRSLSPTLFWNYPTISDLAAHLANASMVQAGVDDGRG